MNVNWLSANPFKVGSKDPQTMTAGEINREMVRLNKEGKKISRQLIEAGRGNETYGETEKKDDPLSLRFKELYGRRQKLYDEIRIRYGPGWQHLDTLPRQFGPRWRP